jgi:hypothetical protein
MKLLAAEFTKLARTFDAYSGTRMVGKADGKVLKEFSIFLTFSCLAAESQTIKTNPGGMRD